MTVCDSDGLFVPPGANVCCWQDELLVVKDKVVLEIVDLVKWLVDEDDDDVVSALMTSRAARSLNTDR